jgi:hypothetical protein
MDDTTVRRSIGRPVGQSIVKPVDTGRLAGRSIDHKIDRSACRPTGLPTI